MVGLAGWIFPISAAWIDRHRAIRVPPELIG
jgi:hypothetical protein